MCTSTKIQPIIRENLKIFPQKEKNLDTSGRNIKVYQHMNKTFYYNLATHNSQLKHMIRETINSYSLSVQYKTQVRTFRKLSLQLNFL